MLPRALVLTCLLLALPGRAAADFHYSSYRYLGLGVAGDYAYGGRSDGGIYLTGHLCDTAGIATAQIALDAGYRFAARAAHLRLALEASFLYFGGYLGLVSGIGSQSSLGASVGGALLLPTPWAHLALLVGANIHFFNTGAWPHELMIRDRKSVV